MVREHTLYSFDPLVFLVLWGQNRVNFGKSPMDAGTYCIFLCDFVFYILSVRSHLSMTQFKSILTKFLSAFLFYCWERFAKIILSVTFVYIFFCLNNYHFTNFDGMCLIIYKFRISSSCVLKL